MTRKLGIVLLVLCVLLLSAGFLPAKDTPGSKKPPTDRQIPRTKISVQTKPGYRAGLLFDNLYYPAGIGVSARGDCVVHTEWDSYIYMNLQGLNSVIDTGSDELHVLRYRGGGIYAGDVYGSVWKSDDRNTAAYLGSEYYGDDICGLDVDPMSGAVWFITNWEDGYWWSGLWKLMPGSTDAILVDSWEDEPGWGLAVKGDNIYVSDWYGDSVWKYNKPTGNWYEILFGFEGPTDIGFDSAGNMYVAEYGGGNLAMVKNGSTKINRIAWGFYEPYYLELDQYGNIYLTDYGTWQIWKIRKK